MTTKKSYIISDAAQKNVIAYLQSRYSDFPIESQRKRLELIDKALQLESDLRRKDRADYFQDTEIPVARAPISKLANFLIDTFVGTQRIFEVVSPDPANAGQVKQFNTIMEENSNATNWTREVVLFLRDLGKYPYAAISCDWLQEEVISIISDSASEKANAVGAVLGVVGREGNVLDRWDPYNTFYDTSVPINKLHTKGEFTGTTKRISQITLFQLLSNFKIGGNHVMNDKTELWKKASTTPNRHYTPSIKPAYDVEESKSGWGAFFGVGPTSKDQRLMQLGKGARYEYTILNARIIPEMFGMKVPAADKVQIWQFHVINWDTIIYAEKQSNAHGYLPSVFAQIADEGIGEQSKTNAELVVPIQNLSTHIHDVRLAAMKRSVGDRALYDSSRITKDQINSERPDAKIAVTPNILKNTSLSDAYYSIPFNDNISGTYYQELNYLSQLAETTVGFNRPQQGQFQKGNKTLGEYNDVMNNADDDLRTFSKLTEAVALVPLKTIIKTNILQYQPAARMVAQSDGQDVTVNPAELRRTAMQFKLADGLVDKTQMLDLPTANNLLQLVLQVPALQQRYDIAGLVNHIMGSVGFDTTKFDNGGQGGQAPQGQAPAGLPAPAQPPTGA